MTAVASRLGETLPAKPLSITDIYALKSEGQPDVSPILGLQPDPRETVILLQVTTGSTIHYLGVEWESGWEVLETIPLDGSTAIETAIQARLDSIMEWADTYYATEQFAILQKVRC